MIIDTHLHVWSDDFERYPFTEGRREIDGASVELLNQAMEEAGVDRAVIVQPIHYLYDNRYVIDCLCRFPGKFAGVGLVAVGTGPSAVASSSLGIGAANPTAVPRPMGSANPTAVPRPSGSPIQLAACNPCNPCAAGGCNPCNPCSGE